MEKNVKYLVMDVDGTLTDGKIYIGNEGELMKAFNVKDGCGIHDILLQTEITPIIITGRTSVIVEKRSREIGITELFQGINDKEEYLRKWINEKGINCDSIAYIGDDINDLSAMQLVKRQGGVIGCPANAVEKIKEIADFISKNNGGEGAVRDFIEWLIKYEAGE